MSADLHCHTVRSDGSDTPDFVAAFARQRGLSAVALTDHDRYADAFEAAALSHRYGVRVIPGVECSARDKQRGNKVHILCYLCKRPEAVADLLRRQTESRTQAVLQMTAKAARLFPITEEMVTDGVRTGDFLGKQHIMLALMRAGYATEMYGDLYFDLFSKKTGRCYVPFEDNDMLDVVRALRETGGVIVMAHPSVYRSIVSLPDLIREGIHGIELDHPHNTPADRRAIRRAADEHGLLLTGGTDFHGYFTQTERLLPLGSCGATDEQLDALLALADRLP